MEKGWLRTLMVLACGAAMALMAYAGQSGPSNGSLHLGDFEEESIYVREIGGLRLDYRLVSSPFSERPESPSKPAELVLYIASNEFAGELEARVSLLVVGPRGSQLKALALPSEGRYEADIFLAGPGIYRITTEIQTPRGTIRDVFDHAIS